MCATLEFSLHPLHGPAKHSSCIRLARQRRIALRRKHPKEVLAKQGARLERGLPTEDGWSSKQGCVKGASSRSLRTIRPPPCCHASPKIQTFDLIMELHARPTLLISTGDDQSLFPWKRRDAPPTLQRTVRRSVHCAARSPAGASQAAESGRLRPATLRGFRC